MDAKEIAGWVAGVVWVAMWGYVIWKIWRK